MSPGKEIALQHAFVACIDAHGGNAKVLPGGGILSEVTPATSARLTAAQTLCRKLVPIGSSVLTKSANRSEPSAKSRRTELCTIRAWQESFPSPKHAPT